MAKQKRSNYVTRKVTVSRTYEIFSVKDNVFTSVGTKDISGKVKESTLREDFNISDDCQVVTVEKAVNTKIYGMLIDDFMKLAKELQ